MGELRRGEGYGYLESRRRLRGVSLEGGGVGEQEGTHDGGHHGWKRPFHRGQCMGRVAASSGEAVGDGFGGSGGGLGLNGTGFGRCWGSGRSLIRSFKGCG